jgi:four helix bundle protein
MFDFEKLEVYQIASKQNIDVLKHIFRDKRIDDFIKDQWKRCSLSIVLNLAEGTGRITNADKKHFITLARGSVFEAVAILDSLRGLDLIDAAFSDELYKNYESISKMLLAMFRSYDK